MKYILSLLIALAVFSAKPSHALSPEAQADLLLIRAIAAIEAEDHSAAMDHFGELAALDVPKPEAFLFHYGKTALKAGEFEIAQKMLERYIDTAGSSGEFYQSALKNYLEAEQRKEAEVERVAAQERRITQEAAQATAAKESSALCDQLAAQAVNMDTPKNLEFVRPEDIDGRRAISACRAAVANFPSNARMKYQLGIALLHNSKEDEAFQWFEQAARQGYAAAQSQMGKAVIGGYYGFSKDKKEAMRWYQKAADQGDPIGLNKIAMAYHNGLWGYSADRSRAHSYFTRAAKTGIVSAQVDAATSLVSDGRFASHWLGVAVGNATAQKMMQRAAFGVRYYYGANFHSGNNNPPPVKNVAKAAVFHLVHLRENPNDNFFKKDWDELVAMPAFARGVQKELAALGYYTGAIDGKFGAGSMAALRAYCGC